MENLVLIAKHVMFLAMTLFVIGTLGATLITGIWKEIQDKTEILAGRAHLPTRIK
jgi:hypothetical protein